MWILHSTEKKIGTCLKIFLHLTAIIPLQRISYMHPLPDHIKIIHSTKLLLMNRKYVNLPFTLYSSKHGCIASISPSFPPATVLSQAGWLSPSPPWSKLGPGSHVLILLQTMFLKENNPCSANLRVSLGITRWSKACLTSSKRAKAPNAAVGMKQPAVWICTRASPRTGVGTDGLTDRTAFDRATLPSFPSQPHKRLFYLHDELRLR